MLCLSQIFIKRDYTGRIRLIIAEVTDDIFMEWGIPDIVKSADRIIKRFKRYKTILDNRINFSGSRIEQNSDGHITLSMNEFTTAIPCISNSRASRRMNDDTATAAKASHFRPFSGSLMWLENGALPQASYVRFYLQEKMSSPEIKHLMEANVILKETKNLYQTIKFRKTASKAPNSIVCTFPGASYNISTKQVHGQTVFITGIAIDDSIASPMYYITDWSSAKERRVTRSSYGVGIFSSADADDRCYMLKAAFNYILNSASTEHDMNVD